MQRFFTLASFVALASVASAQIQINEIRIDQGGADNDEYFELVGPAGMPLDGLSYIVIGDASGNAGGYIESVTDLTGLAIAADGLFLGAESTFTIGTADDMALSLNFENSDNVTHLLVSDFTGAVGDDIDADDDGVADNTPWTAILDGIALIETTDTPTSGEFYYTNLPNVVGVGPDGSFVPGHVFRCDNGVRIGEFTVGVATETPGEPNFCPAVTEVFCAPALANSVSTEGSTLELVSASGGSITANDSMLVVTNTPDDFGVFAQSMSTMSPVALAAGGNLCLGYPDIQRLGAPVVASGNTASYTLDFVSGGAEILTMAGDTVYYQWYHRDGAGASNLSEGLAITWIE